MTRKEDLSPYINIEEEKKQIEKSAVYFQRIQSLFDSMEDIPHPTLKQKTIDPKLPDEMQLTIFEIEKTLFDVDLLGAHYHISSLGVTGFRPPEIMIESASENQTETKIFSKRVVMVSPVARHGFTKILVEWTERCVTDKKAYPFPLRPFYKGENPTEDIKE